MFNSIINYPPFVSALNVNLSATITTLDLSGEQLFLWGTPISESWTSGTKDITGVRLIYTTVTANSSSVFNISLQLPSASANVYRPDGIPLAVWSGSVTTASFSTTTPVTHSFTSSYTISPNTKLGVVFKYDIFSASTAVSPRAFLSRGEFSTVYGASTSTTTGSTWGTSTGILPIQFICSDGSNLTYNGVPDAFIVTSFTSNEYTSTATGTGIDSGDERGMLWIPKRTYDIDKFVMLGRLVNTTTITNFNMYRDTTLLAQKTYTSQSNPNLQNFYRYSVDINPPVRVYPNDNIRFTTAPQSGSTRHVRISFGSTEQMKNFLGGDDDEIEFSFTNRVDGGAWNTPSGATSSLHMLQIYGNEVTGSALLSGSLTISGSVTLGGQVVSGARVYALRQSDGLVITTQSANDGGYQFNLSSSTYHVFVEHTTGSQQYNATSLWDIQPV